MSVARRLAAILAADVVGFSRLMEADEAGTLAALKARRKTVLEPLVAKHAGRVFKITGDGVLVEFASAVNAVQCAVELQKAFADSNKDVPDNRQIVLRIGVNLGDVMVEGGDLYGDGVNIAARLEELAEPGTVCVSHKVREEIGRKLELDFDDLGERRLKNIDAPIRVSRLRGGAGEQAARLPLLPLPDKPSIAILPFDNLSGDPEQQYFSDGIAEDVITDLSKLSGLFVIARNSAFAYRGKNVNVRQASRELGVRYVLEGSVRKAGNRVRIAAQLIDGTTGGHLWAERYDRDLTDIFQVQDEVTREIVTALAIKLTPGEQRRLRRKGTDDLAAYDHYLRGRQLVWLRSKDSNEEARVLLERAIELDGGFSSARAILGFAHVLNYLNSWRGPPEESLRRAHELAQSALALDMDDPEAHWVLGLTHLWMRQHDRAIAEARRAIALDANFAWAYTLLGQALHYAGRSRDAIDPIATAMRLDPNHDDMFHHFLAQSYFSLGRYDEAATALKRRILRKPDTDISRVLLAACYGHLGRHEEARTQWREALRINPDYSLEHRRRILPYMDAADFERVDEGLRRAGLPE
jgi:TolB-like protein/Flp pilus assembly protein TadD